jgi:hypothetical protein
MPIPIQKFPGLRAPESIILATYQRGYGDLPVQWAYNVPVGKGTEPPSAMPTHLKVMHVKNSQRKIDAILTDGQHVTLIEVKERAQLGSIGQLLGYAHLWQSENPGSGEPTMLLLTARLSPGVKEVAEKYGITVRVVPVDFSALTGPV